MTDFLQPPSFHKQLQADKVTLEAMIENQYEHAKQLTAEAGDPLRLGAASATTRGVHDTYIQALEHARDVLNSLLG
jgi:hypothetical protein